MATETLHGPLGEWRAASTAGGGTALTGTATRIVLPRGTKQVVLIPRNFATATVVKFNFNPFLTVLKTADALVSEPTNYSEEAQDNSTSTDITLSSLDTLANGDAVFVGAFVPFGGLVVDVDSTNSTASVLTAEYWNGSAWTDISASDGTASGGATFAQDGSITWTVPASWASVALKDAVSTAKPNVGMYTEPQYWLRLSVSVALDSSVTLNSMVSINRDTTYAELPSGMALQQGVTVGPGGIYSVTALTDAGTANLIVNCATRSGGRF